MSISDLSTVMNMINLNDSLLREQAVNSAGNFNTRKEGRKLVGNSSMLDEGGLKSRSETLPANWTSGLMRQHTVNTTTAMTSSGLTSVDGHRRIDRSVSLPLNGAYLSEKDDRVFPSSDGKGGMTSPSGGRYKTELCRPFEENGFCKYGDKCQFAHGRSELRILLRHPKYKTELCRTYHTTGICPYGPRCHFVHNSEECNLSIINQQLLQHQQIQQQQLKRDQQLQQLRELILTKQKLDELARQLSPNTMSPTNVLQSLLSSSSTNDSASASHVQDDRRLFQASFKRSSIGSSSNSPTPSCSGSDSRSASPDSLTGEIREDPGRGFVLPSGLMTSRLSHESYPLASPETPSTNPIAPFSATSCSKSVSSANETTLSDLLRQILHNQTLSKDLLSSASNESLIFELLRTLNSKVQ